jgi:hypothetical protein
VAAEAAAAQVTGHRSAAKVAGAAAMAGAVAGANVDPLLSNLSHEQFKVQIYLQHVMQF